MFKVKVTPLSVRGGPEITVVNMGPPCCLSKTEAWAEVPVPSHPGERSHDRQGLWQGPTGFLGGRESGAEGEPGSHALSCGQSQLLRAVGIAMAWIRMGRREVSRAEVGWEAIC